MIRTGVNKSCVGGNENVLMISRGVQKQCVGGNENVLITQVWLR